jgi:hypothetical protein
MLRRKASTYRRLAAGVNDDRTLAILEEMARELQVRAERLEKRALARQSRGSRHRQRG